MMYVIQASFYSLFFWKKKKRKVSKLKNDMEISCKYGKCSPLLGKQDYTCTKDKASQRWFWASPGTGRTRAAPSAVAGEKDFT